MASIYQDIASSPFQDFGPPKTMGNGLKSKTVLMDLIRPEASPKLDDICKDLDRMLAKEASGKYHVSSCLDPNENRHQVFPNYRVTYA